MNVLLLPVSIVPPVQCAGPLQVTSTTAFTGPVAVIWRSIPDPRNMLAAFTVYVKLRLTPSASSSNSWSKPSRSSFDDGGTCRPSGMSQSPCSNVNVYSAARISSFGCAVTLTDGTLPVPPPSPPSLPPPSPGVKPGLPKHPHSTSAVIGSSFTAAIQR